jgi:hypothetical protein
MSDATEPVYLFVPPEEYATVEARGASWDDASKRWYVRTGEPRAAFAPWLGDAERGTGEEAELSITSSAVFVASAKMACVECGGTIEVIALYCESAVEDGTDEPMRQVTLSNIWAMDERLRVQLERWPWFKATEAGAGAFANHCRHCEAAQEEHWLHAEPGDVFFGLARGGEAPGPVEFTALEGEIRVGADYSLTI